MTNSRSNQLHKKGLWLNNLPIHVKTENQGSGSEKPQIPPRPCHEISRGWWRWKAKGSEGHRGSYKESEALLTGTDWKPCAPLPTRARQGMRRGGWGWLPYTARWTLWHLQPDSLTSASNDLLQHRRGQLIGDRQVLRVPGCAHPAERPEALGEYIPARTKRLITHLPKLAAPTGWARSPWSKEGRLACVPELRGGEGHV